MDADNDLSGAVNGDLQEIKEAGSSEYVEIIIQLDLPGKTTKRYRINGNSLELLQDMGEKDMASAETLRDFLSWAKDSFPSDRRVLILWNHGNGWDQGDGLSASPSWKRSILNERGGDNNSGFLPNYKVRDAIESSGIGLDILGLDACTMATIEALYEFRNTASIIIASEEIEEAYGWDYRSLLRSLHSRPSMSPEEFSSLAVYFYRRFFEDFFYPSTPSHEKRHSLVALYTDYLEPIAMQIDSIARDFISLLQDQALTEQTIELLKTAREAVQEVDYYNQAFVYVDLLDLLERLQRQEVVGELFQKAIIAETHGIDRPRLHGISIVFFKLPEARLYNTFDPNYKNYDPLTGTGNRGEFINTYNWDEFIHTFYRSAGLLD